jgi:hypothetical protein
MFESPSLEVCYRSDKFTTASFVSQSANVPKQELEKIDLLPRIRHKALLTPELSTIFRGKRDDLAERFSTITRVLDGQGLMTDSGTHGQRGYAGDYLFAWLGATTPFDECVWDVMAQLGSRLFFFLMDATEQTVDELIRSNSNIISYRGAVQECQSAIHGMLSTLFAAHKGARGMRWDAAGNPAQILRTIAYCAQLLALMRTPFNRQDAPSPESAHRANAVLYNLARGHALVSGRTYLTTADLPLVALVTLSSMRRDRRELLGALVKTPSSLTVAQAALAIGGSRDKATRVMEEFDWLGVASYNKHGPGTAGFLIANQQWVLCADQVYRALLYGAT